MLEVSEAREKILEAVNTISGIEKLNLKNALGRILAENIYSSVDVPPADNSAMDGYALRVCDFETQSALEVSQRIPAGQAPEQLTNATVARIFTGAEVPSNADAVVMQENTELTSDGKIKILKKPSLGDNIRPQGQDIANGACILQKGNKLAPQHLGLLASIGHNDISVVRQLNIALLSTGNELVEPGKPLQPGQIYNSNQAMLAASFESLGCNVQTFNIVGDTFEDTVSALENCASLADIIISTGGVSVGEEDHVKAAVEHLGELAMWKVKIKPGKPLAFGHVGAIPFLGLPGNPVSAFVTFLLFGIPLIKKLQGQNLEALQSYFLPINFEITKPRTRPEYLRVKIQNNHIEKFKNQSSGVLTSVCWANALAVIPADVTLSTGDLVEVFPFDSLINA